MFGWCLWIFPGLITSPLFFILYLMNKGRAQPQHSDNDGVRVFPCFKIHEVIFWGFSEDITNFSFFSFLIRDLTSNFSVEFEVLQHFSELARKIVSWEFFIWNLVLKHLEWIKSGSNPLVSLILAESVI